MSQMMQGIKYSVDIVLCIDATGSMGPLISEVKAGALRLYEDLGKLMLEKDKAIDHLRVRVVVFRDYYCDGTKSLAQSEFFTLPQEKEAFHEFVGKITAEGGGDEPENGLEALAFAIKSDWSKVGDKRRQIIVVWTDASTHKLEKAQEKPIPHYPQDLPKTFDELTDLWEGQDHVNRSFKRLVLYAPDSYAWTDIGTN